MLPTLMSDLFGLRGGRNGSDFRSGTILPSSFVEIKRRADKFLGLKARDMLDAVAQFFEINVKEMVKFLKERKPLGDIVAEGNKKLQWRLFGLGNLYMAASEAAMEAVWIRKFVGDLGVMPSIKEPINMYYDNSAAIIFAKDSRIMKCARHFLRRYHYVREQVESGEIKILKVHTDDNLADPFTKALPRGKVTDLGNGIGLQLASSFMHTCDCIWIKDIVHIII
ncbi:hypothetical protein Tco_0761368 [Tanacetum coccineum]